MENKLKGISMAAALALITVPMFGQAMPPKGSLSDRVRHELVMLPYYNIFDDLSYSVDNTGTVTLSGDVTQPIVKDEAGRVVKKVEGVATVVNNIKVLPLSPMDNRIRAATYRAIFGGSSPLYRYSMGAVPSIHIIVDNGHVTLKGVVANKFDRNVAYMRANGVAGVFSVTNDLLVQGKS